MEKDLSVAQQALRRNGQAPQLLESSSSPQRLHQEDDFTSLSAAWCRKRALEILDYSIENDTTLPDFPPLDDGGIFSPNGASHTHEFRIDA